MFLKWETQYYKIVNFPQTDLYNFNALLNKMPAGKIWRNLMVHYKI